MQRALPFSTLPTLLMALLALAAACAPPDVFSGANAGAGGAADGCGQGEQACDGACVSLATSHDHCGSCANTCAEDEVCAEGQCQAYCPPDRADCAGGCVDPGSDPDHCGGCGNACAEGEVCVNYSCRCGPGQEMCGGTCKDVTSDPHNCGGCGIDCSASADCIDAACVSLCSPPEEECSGQCVDKSSDLDNCGGCGIGCDADLEICQGGSCVCLEPLCGLCGVPELIGVPQLLTGSTVGASNSFDGGCGPGGPDAVFVFTPPTTASYRISTEGSQMPALVSLRSIVSCSELACAQPEPFPQPEPYSQLNVVLVGGQPVLIVVEGMSNQTGPFQLTVDHTPECPEVELASPLPLAIPGTTFNKPFIGQPSCAPVTTGEATFGFTAPESGSYLFATQGYSADAVLAVRPDCFAADLACSPGFGGDASVMVPLSQGQHVVVAVAGSAGPSDFTLTIALAPPQICPQGDLGALSPQTVTGSTVGNLNALDPSCGSPGGAETTYSFTAPGSGTYTFDTIGSTFDTVLHIHDTACVGPELACDDDGGGNLTSRIDLPLIGGDHVIIYVDGFGGQQGNFVLNVAGP